MCVAVLDELSFIRSAFVLLETADKEGINKEDLQIFLDGMKRYTRYIYTKYIRIRWIRLLWMWRLRMGGRCEGDAQGNRIKIIYTVKVMLRIQFNDDVFCFVIYLQIMHV